MVSVPLMPQKMRADRQHRADEKIDGAEEQGDEKNDRGGENVGMRGMSADL